MNRIKTGMIAVMLALICQHGLAQVTVSGTVKNKKSKPEIEHWSISSAI